MTEAFVQGLYNLASRIESDNWYLLYADNTVTLFSPAQTLSEIIATLRTQRVLPRSVPGASKATFVSLSANFAAKIGLSASMTGSMEAGQPQGDLARRLEHLLLEWTQRTLCNLSATTSAGNEENANIEKEIEFVVYDLVGRSRRDVMMGHNAKLTPAELPYLAGRRQMLQIITWMNESFCDPTVSATKAAKQFRISVRQLHKLFEYNEEKLTFLQTLKSIRLQNARNLLETPEHWHLSIADIAEKSGFASAVYFGRTFRQYFKISPGAFRKKHMDLLMRQYAVNLASSEPGGESSP